MKIRKPVFIGAAVACCLALPCLATAAPKDNDVSRGTFRVESLNDSPAWMVRLSVNHDDHVYRVGDNLVAKVRSEKAGYLYLFSVGPDGEVVCLFPNKAQKDNRIGANEDVAVPDSDDAAYSIKMQPPTGKELLKAIVTREPLKSLDLSDLTKSKATSISRATFRDVFDEAETGQTGKQKPDQSLGDDKEKLKREHPDQYQRQSQEYAEHDVEITSLDKGDPNPQQQRGKGPHQVAVLVGLSRFKDSNIRPLQCSDKDAERMQDALKGTHAFDQTWLLTNEQATLKNIESVLVREALEATQPGDLVLIYWSGHGGLCAGEERQYDGFLVPYDGNLDDLNTIRSTMVLDKTFTRWVQELDGRRVAVILDTCHSGAQIKDAPLDKGTAKNVQRFAKTINYDMLPKKDSPFLQGNMSRMKALGQKDAAVLASSSVKQFSFERKEGDMSVMTYYVVQDLGKLRGTVPFNTIGEDVKDPVQSYVSDNFPGTTQTPVFQDLVTPLSIDLGR